MGARKQKDDAAADVVINEHGVITAGYETIDVPTGGEEITVKIQVAQHEGQWYAGHLFVIRGAAGGSRQQPCMDVDNSFGTRDDAVDAMVQQAIIWMQDFIAAHPKGALAAKLNKALAAVDEFIKAFDPITNDGWTCPDCGEINDADSGECDCGTTYDGPGDGEGEILPAVRREAASEGQLLPALPAGIATRVKAINALHAEIEEHLAKFAERVVMCGSELLALKKEVGHGKWEKFFEANIARDRFQLRHAQNYMEVAKAVQLKIAQREGAGAAMLLDGECATPGTQGHELIRETLADMTDARSWQQLWLDMGLLRSQKPRGGDHGGGAAMAAKARDAHGQLQFEMAVAKQDWNELIYNLRDFVLTHKRHLLLQPGEVIGGRQALGDVVKALPE